MTPKRQAGTRRRTQALAASALATGRLGSGRGGRDGGGWRSLSRQIERKLSRLVCVLRRTGVRFSSNLGHGGTL